MTFDLLYLTPSRDAWQHLMTSRSLATIRAKCRRLDGKLAAATHITIIRQDGVIVHDTRVDGIDF